MATSEQIIKRLGKLQSTLLTSGLQQSNQPLYQVISQLIDAIIASNEAVVSGSSGSGGTGATGAQGPMGPPGIDGDSGSDGDIGPPGIRGIDGITGAQGPQGPPGLEGDIGPEGDFWPIPGPQGPTGNTGATGPQGPIGLPGEDGIPEDPWIIPGPQGPAGSSGGGGGFTFTDFTKDLGAGNRAGTFDITGLSGLTPNKNVLIVQTMQPISSKGDARDEFELQPIILTGYVVDANTIRALWNCDSVCVGTYAFAYAVSG